MPRRCLFPLPPSPPFFRALGIEVFSCCIFSSSPSPSPRKNEIARCHIQVIGVFRFFFLGRDKASANLFSFLFLGKRVKAVAS